MAEVQLKLGIKDISETYGLTINQAKATVYYPNFPAPLRETGPKGSKLWARSELDQYFKLTPKINWWEYMPARNLYDTENVSKQRSK